MTNFQEFLHKSYGIQERFNHKGEFIRDKPDSHGDEPTPKEKKKPKSRGSKVTPAKTDAEKKPVEGAKTPEHIEQERQRRMKLAKKMLQNP